MVWGRSNMPKTKSNMPKAIAAAPETAAPSEFPTDTESAAEIEMSRGSALDSVPAEDRPGIQEKRERRKRGWCVVKVEDYRLQALTPADPEFPADDLDWGDLGPDTYITTDREEAFQTARRERGLLMSCDGLPAPGRIIAFKEAVKRMLGISTGF